MTAKVDERDEALGDAPLEPGARSLEPSPSFVPRLAKKARLRHDRHSGGFMIVYPERGLALNESAAEIVKRCDGTRTVAQIALEIVREIDVQGRAEDRPDPAEVERDVLELVSELARKGLLER
jgi:coenzyme PQQ biosynthesis protein PqqD